MKSLADRIDQAIGRIERLNRRAAFGELQAVFGAIQQRVRFSEAELKRYFDLLTLVLLVHPRGMRIRISGARSPGAVREERLDFNDFYEVALERTLEFLSRNLLRHLEEYTPLQYLRAVLRALAKEYALARTHQQASIPVDAILERVEPDEAWSGSELQTDDAPAYLKAYEYVLDVKPGGEVFYDWFVGDLSRREISALRGMTREEVDQAILGIARTEFEQGRLYPLVQSLISLEENGDILWLWLKGLTAEQIGEKVALSHWVVYKRPYAVRRKFARLRTLGSAGRQFGAWLCGMQPNLIQEPGVQAVLAQLGAELGLNQTEFLPAASDTRV